MNESMVCSNGMVFVGVQLHLTMAIVSMASKKCHRNGVDSILSRANYKRGVVVKSDENQVTVDVYIIVGYGLKISEVSRNVQDSVKYNLRSQLGIDTKAVNVVVQGVKVLDD